MSKLIRWDPSQQHSVRQAWERKNRCMEISGMSRLTARNPSWFSL
jgi:hypothetical protein